jgi:hypothetical protein
MPHRPTWATLLDEGVYLGLISMFYRLLRQAGETRERRRQASHPARIKPELAATAPNQMWSPGHHQTARAGEMDLLPPIRDLGHDRGRPDSLPALSLGITINIDTAAWACTPPPTFTTAPLPKSVPNAASCSPPPTTPTPHASSTNHPNHPPYQPARGSTHPTPQRPPLSDYYKRFLIRLRKAARLLINMSCPTVKVATA